MKHILAVLLSLGIILPAGGALATQAEARSGVIVGPNGGVAIYHSGKKAPPRYRHSYGPRHGYRAPPPPPPYYRPHHGPMRPHHAAPPPRGPHWR